MWYIALFVSYWSFLVVAKSFKMVRQSSRQRGTWKHPAVAGDTWVESRYSVHTRTILSQLIVYYSLRLLLLGLEFSLEALGHLRRRWAGQPEVYLH